MCSTIQYKYIDLGLAKGRVATQCKIHPQCKLCPKGRVKGNRPAGARRSSRRARPTAFEGIARIINKTCNNADNSAFHRDREIIAFRFHIALISFGSMGGWVSADKTSARQDKTRLDRAKGESASVVVRLAGSLCTFLYQQRRIKSGDTNYDGAAATKKDYNACFSRWEDSL